MSKSHRKVEEQKGPIHSSQETSKMMKHPEKVREAQAEANFRRTAQTLHTHMPKSGKK